ncbi:phage tail protein [Photorhabdus temperata subsp. temperata]
MKYFAILTALGAAKLANATALGTKINLTHMAVGDGGGKLPEPGANQTQLINEKRRAAINTLSVDPVNTNQIIAEQIIPEGEGGWWMREIGLFDSEGSMIAVANCPETYKPQLQEGSGRTQTVRMILIVNSTESVTLKVDPSVVLATREYVDKNTIEVKAYCDNAFKAHLAADDPHQQYLLKKDLPPLPDATLSQKGVTQLSSATNSSSEIYAATPNAVKTAYDLANVANNNANNRVPASRNVNGKALSSDITLNASDVGAYTKGETDSRVNAAQSLANTANQNAVNANNNANTKLSKSQNGADIPNKSEFIKNLGLSETVNRANGAVPSSRKVNGKALSGDISLSAGDVGACRAYSGSIDTATGMWTTAEFLQWLKTQGAFDNPYWMCKGSWSYADNRIINDTGCGNICLAGAVVEVMGVESAMTIRVTTPTTTNGNGIASVQFTYVNHGEGYYPGWRRDYNTKNKPSAEDVGAFPGFIFVNSIPTRSYVGAWGGSGNGSSGWVKGLNIGTAGSDVGQLYIDPDGNLYAYFLNNNGFTRGGAVNTYPVGSPIPWPQPNPPSGYLACNGQTFNKSTYPQLAAAYPNGRVPDLRGEFIRGWDDNRGVDSGRGVLSYQEGQAPVSAIAGYWDNDNWKNGKHRETGFSAATGTDNGGWHNIIQEYENQRETRPRNIAFNYIVRAA